MRRQRAQGKCIFILTACAVSRLAHSASKKALFPPLAVLHTVSGELCSPVSPVRCLQQIWTSWSSESIYVGLAWPTQLKEWEGPFQSWLAKGSKYSVERDGQHYPGGSKRDRQIYMFTTSCRVPPSCMLDVQRSPWLAIQKLIDIPLTGCQQERLRRCWILSNLSDPSLKTGPESKHRREFFVHPMRGGTAKGGGGI